MTPVRLEPAAPRSRVNPSTTEPLRFLSEINAYQKQIKVISFSLYFNCNVLWITPDFSIHLMHFNSELQTPIISLFVNENIIMGKHFLS